MKEQPPLDGPYSRPPGIQSVPHTGWLGRALGRTVRGLGHGLTRREGKEDKYDVVPLSVQSTIRSSENSNGKPGFPRNPRPKLRSPVSRKALAEITAGTCRPDWFNVRCRRPLSVHPTMMHRSRLHKPLACQWPSLSQPLHSFSTIVDPLRLARRCAWIFAKKLHEEFGAINAIKKRASILL